MLKSDSIKELTAALSKAQSEFKPVVKNANNPFFKSTYATLDAVIDATKEALTKNGLAVIQGNEPTETGVIVTTFLSHSSGEWIESQLAMPVTKPDPQGYGSAITYGRRYALSAILNVASEEDDDANTASTKNGTVASPVVKKQTQYTPDPIMDATRDAKSVFRCPECGAMGKFHKPDCHYAN